jgi:predicted PurR-regulated permease PerM
MTGTPASMTLLRSAAMTSESALRPEPAPPVRRLQAPTPRVGLIIATAVVIGVLLYLGRSALTPFLIGLVLVYIFDPAVDWLARRRIGRWRIPRGLAVLVVYIVAAVIVVQAVSLLIGPLVSQVLEYVRDLPRFTRALDEALAGVRNAYVRLDLPEGIRDAIDRALADFGQGAGTFDFGTLLPIARTIAGTIGGFFAFLIVPVWAFYILKDRERLVERAHQALPPAWREDVWAITTIVERVFGRWLRGQLLLGLIVGAATFVGLMILGWVIDPRFIQFAILLAVIAGLFELLPIIGPILSMIPTLLVALTVSNPATAVVAVLVLYVIVQQVENNVLVPMIQGDAIELHPSVVIFALILGGAIAGLIGAIFALPIVAAGRDVYRYLFRRLSEGDPDIPPPKVDPAPPPELHPDSDESGSGPSELAQRAGSEVRPKEAAEDGPQSADSARSASDRPGL